MAATPNFKLPFILLVFYIVINVSNSTTPALPPTQALPPNFLGPSPNTALPPNFLGPYPNTISPALPPNFFGSAPSTASSPSPSPSPKPLPPRPSPLGPPSQGVKAAYWPSFDGFPASSIDTSYFTHIYYAFVLPDPVTYELDIVPFHQVNIPEFINALHARGTMVKTMLSIGGAGNNSTVFSQMASTELTRAVFINSTIRVARVYGFDGVDLDWEYPENDLDMSNLALLFTQWRNALAYEAEVTKSPRLLLTSAVYYASKITFLSAAPTYPGKSIGKYVDWVSPMCFDYHGSWDSITGEHSALYDPNSNISTDFGIQSWIQSGVPPEKIVMGLPLYGHTWTLRDPKVNGVGAPTVGVGPGNGILTYSDIIDYNSENNAVVKFDKQSVSIYSYAGDSWIGYDDILSTKLKIQYARARALGGYFFWALGNDKNWTISREASYAWGH